MRRWSAEALVIIACIWSMKLRHLLVRLAGPAEHDADRREHVDDHRLADEVGMAGREQDRPAAAHRMADHGRALEPRLADVAGDFVGDRDQIGAPGIGAGRPAREARDVDQMVAIAGQRRHRAAPDRRQRAEAGNQDDVRTRAHDGDADPLRTEVRRGRARIGRERRRGGGRPAGRRAWGKRGREAGIATAASRRNMRGKLRRLLAACYPLRAPA